MEFRVRSWLVLCGVLMAVLFSLGMLIYQEPKEVKVAPVTVATPRQIDAAVSASLLSYDTLPLYSCKGKPNCATFMVRDAGTEVFRVSPEGNVTVTGDLTVKGKINGAAATACAPVVCKVEPVACKVEPIASTIWTAVFMGCLGGLVMLVGLKVFDRLG